MKYKDPSVFDFDLSSFPIYEFMGEYYIICILVSPGSPWGSLETHYRLLQ